MMQKSPHDARSQAVLGLRGIATIETETPQALSQLFAQQLPKHLSAQNFKPY